MPGEAGGRVLLAVGQDGDDDLAGSLGFGDLGKTRAEFVDGPADGIEQGGGAAGDESGGVEFDDLRDRQRGAGEEVVVVEENEGEAGVTFRLLLVAQEGVEAGDGGLDHGCHGAGAIEDEGDFGEAVVHCAVTFAPGVGQGWGEGGELTIFDF